MSDSIHYCELPKQNAGHNTSHSSAPDVLQNAILESASEPVTLIPLCCVQDSFEDVQRANCQIALTYNLLDRFYRIFLLFLRKLGYISSVSREVSLIEHQVLLELDTSALQRPSDIARYLRYPTNQLTRIHAALQKRGLIRILPGESLREKFLIITNGGRSILWRLDDLLNSHYTQFCAGFDGNSQRELFEGWELLNDAINAPRSSLRAGEHPLRIQVRRLFRFLEFFGRQSCGSELSYQDIQILDCLRTHPTLDELLAQIPLPRATLKNRVLRLANLGLCTKPSERAGQTIVASESGVAALSRATEQFTKCGVEKFPSHSRATFKRAVTVFENRVKTWSPSMYQHMEVSTVSSYSTGYFRELQIESLLQKARQQFGICSLPNQRQGAIKREQVVMYFGTTPVFVAFFRRGPLKESDYQVIVDEFGCSERTEWSCILDPLAEFMMNIPPDSNRMHVIQLEGCSQKRTICRKRKLYNIPVKFGASAQALRMLLEQR